MRRTHRQIRRTTSVAFRTSDSIGCCWALMALLFIVDIMNLVWIIGLMLFMIAEKTIPFEKFTLHIVGALLIAAGLGVMARLAG